MKSALQLRSDPARILVRGVNWLGDAVMTTPALLRLRERFPNSRIAILSPQKISSLWLHHPAVDEQLAFQAGQGLFSVAKQLRSGHFDLALVLPNSPRSALEARLAGIPQRIGLARSWRDWFLTFAIPERSGAIRMRKRSVTEIQALIESPGPRAPAARSTSDSAHQIHDYLHLVAAMGASAEPLPPVLSVSGDEVADVVNRFGMPQSNPDSAPVFALNPGAEYGPAKRWPADRFAAAARLIQDATRCTWVILGGKGDIDAAEQIAAQANEGGRGKVLNLAGRTSLRELMAVLRFSRVLLTNDTGPMHVAAALGTAVVVPYGSTSPELTGPGLSGQGLHELLRSNAPCSPCFLRQCPIDFRCMNGISVESVVDAVLRSSRRL